MKLSRVFGYLIICTLGLVLSFFSAANIPQTNVSLADLTVLMVDGKTTALSQIQNNKPLYVKFWASWCATCLKEMPKLSEDFKKYGDKIQFITVNIGIEDTQEDVQRIYREYGLEMPAAIDSDGALAKVFGFVGTPYHLLFDKEWRLMHKGYSADDQLSMAFTLLADNPVRKTDLKEINLVEASASQFSQFVLPKNGVVFYTIAWCDWYMQEADKLLAERCKKVSHNIARFKKENRDVAVTVLVSPMYMSAEEINNYKERFALTVPVAVDTGDLISLQYGLRNVGIALVFKGGALAEKIVGVEDYSRFQNLKL